MLTLKQFIDSQYRDYALANQKAGKSNVQRIMGAFPDLTKKRLDSLTNWNFDQWKVRRKQAGVTPATINRDLTMLRAALNKGVEWGVIDANPMDGVKPLKRADSKRVRYLSHQEETRLLEALDAREARIRQDRQSGNEWRARRNKSELPDMEASGFADHLKPMVLLAKNTGLRFSEMSRLRWSDIDLGKSPQLEAKAAHTKDNKTRHIPLNGTATATLRKWKTQQESTAGYVFVHKGGARIKKLRTSWGALLDKAAIRDFKWRADDNGVIVFAQAQDGN